LPATSLVLGSTEFVVGFVFRSGATSPLIVFVVGGNDPAISVGGGASYGYQPGSQTLSVTPVDHSHFHSLVATRPAMSVATDGVATSRAFPHGLVGWRPSSRYALTAERPRPPGRTPLQRAARACRGNRSP
jgi:hypothetical protein